MFKNLPSRFVPFNRPLIGENEAEITRKLLETWLYEYNYESKTITLNLLCPKPLKGFMDATWAQTLQ